MVDMNFSISHNESNGDGSYPRSVRDVDIRMTLDEAVGAIIQQRFIRMLAEVNESLQYLGGEHALARGDIPEGE